MKGIRIRRGKLIRSYGRHASEAGYIFCPAEVEFDDEPQSIRDYRFYLAGYADLTPSTELANAVRGRYDVSWTFARIQRVFFIKPDYGTFGRALDQGFVAVSNAGSTGYPFNCRDFLGRSHLQFSVDEKDDEACRQVSEAFWRLLLANPEDLEDFCCRILGAEEEWELEHLHGLEYGCNLGHLYRERL